MATPRNISTSTAAGTKLRRGRFTPAYVSLLDQIAAAAPDSWAKVNTNRFENAWPDPAFRAPYSTDPDPVAHSQANSSSPSVIIGAWCSFAWDDDAMRLDLWGGGHANGSNGEVYSWRGETQQWHLAFHSTSYEYKAGCGIRSTAGSLNAPTSAHTYSNNVWLPKSQRFLTFGGATHNRGEPFLVSDASGATLRVGGPFTLDMTLAFQGYVGAGTGTNPKRTGTISEGVDLPGANAWKMRDYRLDHPNTAVAAMIPGGRTTVVTEENGRDVIYTHAGSGTSKSLARIEIVDGDYRNDIISIVGAAWGNNSSDVPAALDTKRRLFFNPSFLNSGIPDFFGGWDLSPGKAGPSNRYFSCPAAGVSGPGAADLIANAASAAYSMLYDERRDCFVVMDRDKRMYEVRPPAGTDYTTGWTVKKLMDVARFPADMVDDTIPKGALRASFCGRFKRSKRLDVYVHLTHTFDGQIWVYKPNDWLDPRNA